MEYVHKPTVSAAYFRRISTEITRVKKFPLTPIFPWKNDLVGG